MSIRSSAPSPRPVRESSARSHAHTGRCGMKPGHEHAQHPSRRPSVPRATQRWVIRSTGRTRRCALAHLAVLPGLRVDHPEGPGRRCDLRTRRAAQSRDPRANAKPRNARAQRERGSACPATDGDGSRSGDCAGPARLCARRDGKGVEARDDRRGRGWVVAAAAGTSLPAAHAALGTTFADRLEARATCSSERGVTRVERAA